MKRVLIFCFCIGALVLVSVRAAAAPPLDESIVLNAPATYPHGLTTDGSHLWHTDYSAKILYELDSSSGTIVTQFTMATSSPRGLTWDGTNLWMATASWLYQIDPSDGHTVQSFAGPGSNQQGLAYENGNLWVVNRNENIYCVRVSDQSVITNFPAPSGEPRGLTWHDNRLWNLDSTQDRIYRINPANGEVESSFLTFRAGGRGLTVLSNRFWIADVDQAHIVGVTTQSVENGVLATPYVQRADYYHFVSNNIGIPLFSTHVYIGVPQDRPETDILSRRFFVGGAAQSPDALSTDEFGQVIADFDLGDVPNGTAVTVRMEHVVHHWDWTVHVNTGNVAGLSTIDPAITNLYCRNEDKYNLDDVFIQTTAVAVVNGSTNAYEIARLIHDYVINTITYVKDGIWDDAKTVLQRGSGSCSEYTFSMIALCRSLGVPARFSGGSDSRSLTEGRIDTPHHRWVDVYIPAYGWTPFDPTGDDDTPPREREVASLERGIILRSGGGSNSTLDWRYTSRSTWMFGTAPGDTVMIWSDMSWTDDGDFDGDGIANAFDSFPYDEAASDDTDGDGQPDTWNHGQDSTDSSSIPALEEDEDDDGDGMTDEWEDANGFDPLDPADAGDDSDGDGASNWEEFAAGTSPTNENDCLYLDCLVQNTDQVVEWPTVNGRIYRVWISTNALLNPEWTPTGSAVTAGVEGVLGWTNTLDAEHSYFRIEVYLP